MKDQRARVASLLTRWFATHGRDLPMRASDISPWATLVFEVMSHQTPLSRVQPVWTQWMHRWPTPVELASASPADILTAWDRLGYPSRALRLHECARVVAERPDSQLPQSQEELLALPGVGPYTSSALASFRFHQRVPVLDTNVRRVIHRVFRGVAAAPVGQPTKTEVAHATSLLPESGEETAQWNLELMEFGALACTQRRPTCRECPLRVECSWAKKGYPQVQDAPRRTQAWVGTDRQARGRVLAALRSLHSENTPAPTRRTDPSLRALPLCEALAAATLPGHNDPARAEKILTALEDDGLICVDRVRGLVTFPQGLS